MDINKTKDLIIHRHCDTNEYSGNKIAMSNGDLSYSN